MFNFLIILPLLFPSREANQKTVSCFLMEFSDAQPVQFWLIECDTYNEHVHDGVFHRCFCHPWGCNDPIKVQFTDIPVGSPDTGDDFLLSIRDELGAEIYNLPFEKSNILSLGPLSGATNYGTGADWTLGATPEIDESADSKILRMPFNGASETVDYTFHYHITMGAGFISWGTIVIGLYDSSMDLLDSFIIEFNTGDDEDYEANVVLTADFDTPAYVGVNVTSQLGSPDVVVLEMNLLTESTDPIVYDLSFVPSELSPEICNQTVKFFIVNTSTEEDVARSDCQQISQSTKNTILISYSNHENVFGLVYNNRVPEFNLRIPATFFHQRFPGEDEVMELSHSLATLNSTLRRERLLETDYLPYYFHEKIIMALQHQFVTIINKSWAKQEGYEIGEGNRMAPEKKAKVWLSEREFVQRNVL